MEECATAAIAWLEAGHQVRSVAVFCPENEGYIPQQIARLQSIPIYFFHCPQDNVVPFPNTEALQKKIGNASSRLRIIERRELAFPQSPHVCWSYVYGNPDLYEWLLNPAPSPAAWPNMVLPYV